jgi:8-oxo-dGTP diphosphatase
MARDSSAFLDGPSPVRKTTAGMPRFAAAGLAAVAGFLSPASCLPATIKCRRIRVVETKIRMKMDTLQSDMPWGMSVRAVITDAEGRQLLLRRSGKCRHFVGLWEWPGGKLDPGENFTEGLARELREECGLEVVFTGLAGAAEFAMPALRMVHVCLYARVTAGELRLSEEHDEFAWVPPPELPSWPVVEPMKPVIQQMLARANDFPSNISHI